MEGEEGDSERERDIGLRHCKPERRHELGEVAGDEIGIFEQREDEKIARHRNGERKLSWPRPPDGR